LKLLDHQIQHYSEGQLILILVLNLLITISTQLVLLSAVSYQRSLGATSIPTVVSTIEFSIHDRAGLAKLDRCISEEVAL